MFAVKDPSASNGASNLTRPPRSVDLVCAPLRSVLNECHRGTQHPSRKSPNIHAGMAAWRVARGNKTEHIRQKNE